MRYSKAFYFAFIVGIGLALGASVVVMRRGDTARPAPQPAFAPSLSTTSPAPSAAAGPQFSAETAANGSYRASISQEAKGVLTPAMFEHSKNGVNRYIQEVEGRLVATVYSNTTIYTCTHETCTELPQAAPARMAVSMEQYAYDIPAEELAKLKSYAKYEGKQTCGAVQCHVWSLTHTRNNQSQEDTYYVDALTKRIQKVVHFFPETSTKITVAFAFMRIELAIPPSPSELPRL